MRILQLLPELKIGGVERGTVDLSEYLVKNGHVSCVVSAGGFLVNALEEHGAKHYQLPIAKKNFTALRQVKNLQSIYSEFKPDIIHIRSRFPAWINFFALKKLKNITPKIITTFHGLYSKPFYSKSMSYADEIITISQTVTDYVKKNYEVKESKIHLIYRGCDLDEFNNSPVPSKWADQWYKEFPHTKNKILLTLPGRITGWKGIEFFIDLIDQLPNSDLHGLIPGPVSANKNRYYQSLLQEINKRNLSDQITFCGARNDIANIYKISDIVLNLSSKPEPFGRTIIEAAACGTRVMGWDRGGVKESIGAINSQGLVSYGDIAQFVNKIPIMLNEQAPVSIPNIFTKENLALETLRVYKKTLLN
jgi:glycosyltransferase involved in cell wall biosynthesis